MSETTDPGFTNEDSFISLDTASLRTELPRYKLVKQFRNLWLDCRPLEKSYLWLGRGIVDRRFAPMPELGLLIEESHQIVSSRLRTNTVNRGFALVSGLKVHAGERILELAKPNRGLISNIPAPRLVIANSAFRAKFYPEAQTVPVEFPGEVNEGIPCLVWPHTREELRTYAKLLAEDGYIESPDIWCKHFRTMEEDPRMPLGTPKIAWLKNKKLIRTAMARKNVQMHEGDWLLHFGMNSPGGGAPSDRILNTILRKSSSPKQK